MPFTSHPKFPRIFVILLIAAAIPFTVFVAQQQQDIRQQAANIPDYSGATCKDSKSSTLTYSYLCNSGARSFRTYRGESGNGQCKLPLVGSDHSEPSVDCNEGGKDARTGPTCDKYTDEKPFYLPVNWKGTTCYWHYKTTNTCEMQLIGGHCDATPPSCKDAALEANKQCRQSCDSANDKSCMDACDEKKKQDDAKCGGSSNTASCSGVIDGSFQGKIQPLEFKCQDSCSGEYKNETTSSDRKAKCTPKKCCYKPVNGAPTATATPTPKSSSGSNPAATATPKPNSGGNPAATATPIPSNSRGGNPAATATPKPSNKNRIECTPGESLGEDSKACPDGLKGTCGGHYYCVYDEDGNYKSDFKCETKKQTCFDKNAKDESSSSSSGGSCKDNPTDPPDGYTWKQACSSSCSNNDDCPQNKKDGAVEPSTSNWCYGGKCLMLVSGGSGSNSSNNKNSSNKKDDDDDDDDDKKKNGKDVNDGKTKDDTGNRTKQNNEKTARDKAQKPIDKLNKQLAKEGKPTLTPLPQDWTAESAKNAVETPTPAPTLAPPLPEPTNWQSFCAQTTDATRPWGIRVSWDVVPGAPRYAVRIDEDAPSWEGDTPSPGDTVDNQVTTNSYTRQAKPGATYQWWVHSVNASGVYSGLTKKMIIKCPEVNPGAGTGTPIPQAVGAGQLIVLPPNSTAVVTSPTPTIKATPTLTPTVKPTATPTPKK